MPDFSHSTPPAPDAPPSFLDKPEPAAVESDPYPQERSGLQLYLQEIAKSRFSPSPKR
jgi:hypothetical protein